MNIDIVTVRGDVIIDVVLRYLRIRGELPGLTDNLSVVDRHDNLIGTLALTTLLTSDPQLFVRDVMASGGHVLLAETPADEVAQYFEQHDLVSVPVVDETNHLLGRITIDDVVDVIRDEAEQDLMRMAGLDEEDDVFAPIVPSASKRAVWLGINLLTALLASWVIGLFESTIDQIVALAVLMPIVASMGGIAGSQTLTLVIRSIALGQLGQSNTRWLIFKEISIGMLNGLLWALVVASIAYMWFKSESIGVIIAAAMVINLVIATTAGVFIPLILKRMGIDPALAGTVLLTTITDVVGFMAFLGLATWWLT
jgi:magnesium transporter